VDYRFQIARRYLFSRKDVSLITVITGISVVGVTLGVAALIVVLSVMNGFYDLVRDLMVSIDPHVRIVSVSDEGLTEPDSLMREAMALPQVEQAAAYVEGKALLVPKGDTENNEVVLVRGVDTALLAQNEIVQETGLGSFDVAPRGGTPGIVIDRGLAQKLALLPASDNREGSTVGMLSPSALERTLTQVLGGPPIRRFEVRGLFQVQAAVDRSRVFVALEEAQRVFQMDGRVSGVELRLNDIEQADAVQATLQQRLAPERFRVRTWYDLQKSLYDVMRLEKWGASAILLLIVLVAAFNIIGSLTMVVIQKRSDVGVLQAMGVSRTNIRRIFMLEGMLIGAVGTGLGLVIGLGLTLIQQYFKLVPMAQAESFLINAYPVSIRWLDVTLIAGVAFGLCTLAALYPAVRAASIEPARAVQLDQ